MSKYVRRDHPVQQIPVEELEAMAHDLGTTAEDIRWRMATAHDAGFISVEATADSIRIDLSIPEGGRDG